MQVLGRRLGKSMAAVAKGVAALSQAEILSYEGGSVLSVEGVELGPGDLKIKRDFRAPEGTDPGVCVGGRGRGLSCTHIIYSVFV
jgi:hypothetical protein